MLHELLKKTVTLLKINRFIPVNVISIDNNFTNFLKFTESITKSIPTQKKI